MNLAKTSFRVKCIRNEKVRRQVHKRAGHYLSNTSRFYEHYLVNLRDDGVVSQY